MSGEAVFKAVLLTIAAVLIVGGWKLLIAADPVGMPTAPPAVRSD